MFKKIVNGCVRVMNRWLPDAFLFAIILTIVVFAGAMVATGLGPIAMVNAWGATTGFWSLLSFSMQMALVLVLGSAMASAKPVKKLLSKLAGLAHNNFQAILITTMVSTICSWLNWGFGLIVGALLAKEVAKRVPTVDYPLLIASAYSGFVIWHAGLSGSIPLQMGAEGGTTILGIAYSASTSQTIFHPMNLVMCAVVLLVMPLVNYAMHPTKEKTITIGGKVYPLEDCDFPTVDPEDPYTLTPEEQDMMNEMIKAFRGSEKLQKHIRFLLGSSGEEDMESVGRILGGTAHFDALREAGFCRIHILAVTDEEKPLNAALAQGCTKPAEQRGAHDTGEHHRGLSSGFGSIVRNKDHSRTSRHMGPSFRTSAGARLTVTENSSFDL